VTHEVIKAEHQLAVNYIVTQTNCFRFTLLKHQHSWTDCGRCA